MDMSHAYLQETVAFFAREGFDVEKAERSLGPGVLETQYGLRRAANDEGPAFDLALECVTSSQGERYFLRMSAVGPIAMTPFELDSWRHRDGRVEFKFYTHPTTGTGLAFVLTL